MPSLISRSLPLSTARHSRYMPDCITRLPLFETPAYGIQFYNSIFRRNSVYVPVVFLSAFGFSMGFDLLTTAWWDAHNRGVSLPVSLWSSI